jgi:hypothetical protein
MSYIPFECLSHEDKKEYYSRSSDAQTPPILGSPAGYKSTPSLVPHFNVSTSTSSDSYGWFSDTDVIPEVVLLECIYDVEECAYKVRNVHISIPLPKLEISLTGENLKENQQESQAKSVCIDMSSYYDYEANRHLYMSPHIIVYDEAPVEFIESDKRSFSCITMIATTISACLLYILLCIFW